MLAEKNIISTYDGLNRGYLMAKKRVNKSTNTIEPKEGEPGYIHPRDEARVKGYYFDNYHVEQLMTGYVQGGCTDRCKRDEIMSHATELIRQIIRTHNFHEIYPGHDPASFGDLEQVAWCQIESTLYKFDWSPGHTKVFNMWSQIAKTVILAYIKKETRDRKNYSTYKKHLNSKRIKKDYKFARFVEELKKICELNGEHEAIITSLQQLYDTDDRPYDGLIGKLVKISGLSRSRISNFLKYVRLRQSDFTDSPHNDEARKEQMKAYDGRRKIYNIEDDDD